MSFCRASLLLVALLCMDCCLTAVIPNIYDSKFKDEDIQAYKRPFCNAFTGCGRKRSDITPEMTVQDLFRQRQFADNTIPYMDADVIELSRQILAGAKLWEALQNVGEVSRQRQKYAYN